MRDSKSSEIDIVLLKSSDDVGLGEFLGPAVSAAAFNRWAHHSHLIFFGKRKLSYTLILCLHIAHIERWESVKIDTHRSSFLRGFEHKKISRHICETAGSYR